MAKLNKLIEEYEAVKGSDPQRAEQLRAEIRAFSEQKVSPRPPEPSVLTGVDEENYKETAAKNLQNTLGLEDPIRHEGAVPLRWRAVYKAASSPEEGLRLLQNLAGSENVKPGSKGRVLVRQTKAGETFWSPLDPSGFDIGDITADIAGYIPETVASFITASKMLPSPQASILRILAASGLSSGAGQVAGGIQDAAVRKYAGEPANVPEIVKRRGMQGAMETGMSLIFPIAGSQLARAADITGEAGENISKEIASSARKGQRKLQEMGIQAPLTAGEATGARYPQETERMMEVLGRLSAAGQKVRREQGMVAETVRDMDKIAARPETAVNRWLGALNNAEDAIVRKSQEGYVGALADIQGSVSRELAELGPSAPSITTAGGKTRASVASTYDRANKHARELYKGFEDELARVGADDGIVELESTTKLAKEIKDLVLKKRVKRGRKMVEKPLGLYAPLLREVNDLLEARSTLQSVAAVRSLRSRLLEASRSDQSFSEGIKPATARRIAQALSDDLSTSINSYSGAGADMLKAADTAYRLSLEPFDTSPALKKMIDMPGQGGFLNDSDAITYFSNQGKFNELKNVGAYLDPVQYKELRRAVADDIIGGKILRIGGREFADLGDSLARMERLPPEYKTEIFGSDKTWRSLESGMRRFSYLKGKNKIFMSDALPSPQEVSQFVREVDELGFRAAGGNLRKAIDAAENRQRKFGQGIASQVRNGRYGIVAEAPNKFLDDFAFSGNYSPSYVRSIVNMLPADVMADVQSAAFRRVFDRSRIAAESTIESLKGGKNATFDINKAINDVFGSKQQKETLRTIVGDDLFDKLTGWLQYEMGIAHARRNVGNIGTFSREQFTSIGNWPNLIAKNVAAQVIFSDPGQRVLKAVGSSAEVRQGFIGAISGAFVKTAGSTTGRAAGMVAPARISGEVYDHVVNWNKATKDMSPEEEKAAFAYFFAPELLLEDANAQQPLFQF